MYCTLCWHMRLLHFRFIDDGSNQISEAIKRYGVSDSSSAVLVVRISSPGFLDPQARMSKVISGKLEAISKLETVTDWATIAKVRLNPREFRSE